MSVDQKQASSKRENMNLQVETAIRRNIVDVARQDLSGYTFEKRKTRYPNAKYDLLIFDPNGKAVIEGREFTSRDVSLWLRRESAPTISLNAS
jgi:hypothetical protein